MSLEAKAESFSFEPMRTRLDVFLHGLLHQSYSELWTFCRKLLLLSHGRATVERGFSVNKEVEADNMQDTVVVQRMCDYVSVCGGAFKVPLAKELLAASARSQFGLHLDQDKKKARKAQKRKVTQHHTEQLKKKMTLSEAANSLKKDADKLAWPEHFQTEHC